MKSTRKNEKNTIKEAQPTRPLKKEGEMADNIDERKKKESWAEVSIKEEERKKHDDSRLKTS